MYCLYYLYIINISDFGIFWILPKYYIVYSSIYGFGTNGGRPAGQGMLSEQQGEFDKNNIRERTQGHQRRERRHQGLVRLQPDRHQLPGLSANILEGGTERKFRHQIRKHPNYNQQQCEGV